MKSNQNSENIIPNMIKCRTCLEQADECTSVNITKECTLGRTIKDILLLFIPEMVTLPSVGEFICCKCTRHIRNFTNFIQKCLSVEKVLIEENMKIQNTTRKRSTPVSNGNVDSTPFTLVYINAPQHNQTGTENGLPPIPINLLLSPANDCSDNFDDTMTIDQICDPNISQSEFNIFPELQKPTKMEAISQLEQFELRNSALGNTFCRTCGDTFMSDDWCTIQCSKCATKEKGINLDESDAQSDHFDNEDNGNESETVVDSIGEDSNVKRPNHPNPVNTDTDVTQPNHENQSKEPYVVKTSEVFKRLRGEFRDTIVSVRQASGQIRGFLKELSKSNINVIEYGPFNPTANKRIVLLGNPTTQCTVCRGLVKNPKLLKNHIQTCHTREELHSDDEEGADVNDTVTFNCPFCELTTRNPLALVEHLRQMHRIENPFKCEKCGKMFRKRDSYLDHLKRFEDSPDCFLKKCRFCEEMLSKDEMDNHLKSHRHIVCDQCGKDFSSIYKFKAHYVTHDQNSENPKAEHLCPHCGKLLFNLQNWKQHVKTHGQRTRNYICHMCPKTFIRSSSLRIHINSAHTDKNIACPLCNIKVKTKSALANHHNLKHSESFAHICNICGTGFSRGDYFKRHMRRHAGPTPGSYMKGKTKYNYSVKLESKQVKCKYCLKEFKNVYLLRTHLLSHVKSMRYKCKFCDMTLANNATRLRHQKRHADPNFDLSCPICWKRMVNKVKLEEHLALHEQSKKYTCSVCGQLFNSKYLLKHHVTKEHIPKEEMEKEKQTVLFEALEEFLL